MNWWRKLMRWLVFHVPLGPLAPYVLHMSFPAGVKMMRVTKVVRK